MQRLAVAGAFGVLVVEASRVPLGGGYGEISTMCTFSSHMPAQPQTQRFSIIVWPVCITLTKTTSQNDNDP